MREALGGRNPLNYSLVRYGGFSLYYMWGYGDERKYGKKFTEEGVILKRVLFWVALLIFSVYSCLYVMRTGLGYYRNARIHRDNDRILAEAADRVRKGEEVGSITVYKMYDDNYAEDMAYNKSYIEPWIKGYYELPAEGAFVHEEAWRRQ